MSPELKEKAMEWRKMYEESQNYFLCPICYLPECDECHCIKELAVDIILKITDGFK